MLAPNLLLLSSSRDSRNRYFEFAAEALRDLVSGARTPALFIPFAGVTASFRDYAERVSCALEPLGLPIESIHTRSDPVAAVRSAAAIAVGGGNTFMLLRRLHDVGILNEIRQRVLAGVPYFGWSAGAVLAGPTIRTTNDMPIVEPPTLQALGLIPFQINAHYTDAHPPDFHGETRAERLAEFVAANPGLPVLGLPEGSMIRLRGHDLALLGEHPAQIFGAGESRREVAPGETLAFLLRS
jgi:dipeptidase E